MVLSGAGVDSDTVVSAALSGFSPTTASFGISKPLLIFKKALLLLGNEV